MMQPGRMFRRGFLIFLSALGRPPAPARAADAMAEETATFGGIDVPAERARVLAAFPLGGATAVALAFAADLPKGTRDLFAVAAAGRVVALEVLSWHGVDGSRLYTRLTVVPDGRRLRLERTASAPRGHGFRREQWTDYLAWRDDGPMVDAPVRPVLAGTWQAGLAAQRAGMAATLAVGLRGVPPALVTACPPPLFPVRAAPLAFRCAPGYASRQVTVARKG